MSVVVQARVPEQLQRLRLGYVAERLDAVLADAARQEPTYLDFLDQVPQQETAAKQRKRVAMGIQIALPDGEDARGLRLAIGAVHSAVTE